MELEVSLSVLLSVGGIVASVAATLAIVKTKVSQMEELLKATERKIEDLRETYASRKTDEAVKISLLEERQMIHAKELAEVKGDIKTIMTNVQDIKEAIITVKKGNK